MQKKYVKYQQIVQELPVNQGDELIIASDLTRMAFQTMRREGGFDIRKFLRSFMEVLTPEGTLLIPAYNHDLKSGDFFDPEKTRPVTGSLALSLLGDDQFKRTRNPLHSFYVWGKYAHSYAGLANKSSFGKDSPFAYFAGHQTKMLCISTHIADALTYTHYLESLHQVPYRKEKTIKIKYRIGEQLDERLFSIYAKKKGWINDFTLLEKVLLEKGAAKEMTINGLRFQLLDINAAKKIIEDEIAGSRVAYFNFKLFFKELLKEYLYKLKLYKTTVERIRQNTNLQRH